MMHYNYIFRQYKAMSVLFWKETFFTELMVS